VTFQTDRFMESSPGAAGFEWLLVVLPAAAFLALSRHRRGSTLVLAGVATVVLCFQGTAYLRYVFPVVPMFAAAAGAALDGALAAAGPGRVLMRAAASLAVALNTLFLSAGPFVYRDFPLAAILGSPQRDDYLVRRMPMRRVVEAVNALNYDRAPVVVLADPLGAGLRADALYTNWYNRPWYLAFFTARDTREMAQRLEGFGVEYVIVDAAYPSPEKPLRLLEAVTTRVGGLGTISIRRFRPGETGPHALVAEP
jgi:hypothetical protein